MICSIREDYYVDIGYRDAWNSAATCSKQIEDEKFWRCFSALFIGNNLLTGLAIKMEDRETIHIKKLELAEQWPVYKFQIRVILKSADVWEIVSGKLQKPVAVQGKSETDFETKVKAWEKLDSKAQKFIVTSLGEDPLVHVMNCDTARDMWVKLEHVYEQNSQLSIHLLLQKYYSFSRTEGDGIATHISKLRNLVKRLADLGELISDAMVMTKILMTLPTELSHFHSSWESTATADKTLENLTSRLVSEEMLLETNHANELESQALVAKKKFGASGRMIKCFNCGGRGHVKKNCPTELSDEELPRSSKQKGSAMFSTVRGEPL